MACGIRGGYRHRCCQITLKTILGIPLILVVLMLALDKVLIRQGRSSISCFVVHAMSISSGGNSNTCNTNTENNAKTTINNNKLRPHRILCYGDSLTAGTSNSGYEMYPYAPHLQEGLKGRGWENVVVRHRGLPGWTAASMLDELDGPTTGLQSAIRAVKDPPLSLVIVLAGTNDLGWGFDADTITNNIWKLHQVAFENNVPRTVAIGIPPSGYQSQNEDARNLANQINTNLEALCTTSSSNNDSDSTTTPVRTTATFMPFPFPYENGGVNWDQDTLHFSPKGYKLLGESLVPVVESVLNELKPANDVD